jgi:hypothetical protein
LPSIQKFIVSQATKRGAAHLLEHVELQLRIDVAEEHPLRVAERVRDARLEVGEHAEPRLRVSRLFRSKL